MNNKLPNELSITINGNNADLALDIPENLFWFKGHFPSQSLLPGVVQLNWVIHYSSKIFDIPVNVQSIDVIKFQTPILPNDNLLLHLNLHGDLKKLQFSYTLANRVASSGKITLCQ